MKFVGIIPARYSSTRLPGKPLVKIAGIPLIQRVYSHVKSVLDEVYVATDDQRIFDYVVSFGGKCIMTSPNHKSGTDRCLEAFEKSGSTADVIINIQGDEPFISPELLHSIMDCFDREDVDIATLARPFGNDSNFDDIANPNTPKLIIDKSGFAITFSRSVIPHIRGIEKDLWPNKFSFLAHIGMYAFRSNILKEVTSLPQSNLEIAESLEQLRWIENGYKIKVAITDKQSIGIDTPEDVVAAEKLLSTNPDL